MVRKRIDDIMEVVENDWNLITVFVGEDEKIKNQNRHLIKLFLGEYLDSFWRY